MAVEHPEFPAGLIHLAGVGPGWDLKKHYAANLIERGRILTVPVLGFLLSWTIGPFLPSLAPETALKPMFGPDWENVSPEWIARNTEMRRRPNMIRNVMLEVHNAPVDLEPLRAEISKIKQPVMIIVAELDRNVSRDVSDYLSANLSNARLILITRAAHLFPVVRSGQVVSVIDELANHVPKS